MKSVACLSALLNIGLEIVPQMSSKRAPGGSEGEAGGSSGRQTAKRARKSRAKPRFHGYTEAEIEGMGSVGRGTR